jgi:hypothetical protein
VTTTGGPDHFLADPATSTDPTVLHEQAQPLDGDDIVVEPHGTGPDHPRRRTRELVVGLAVAVLAVGAVAIAIAARHDSGGNTRVTSSARARTPAGHPTADQAVGTRPQVKHPPTPTHPRVSPPNTTPANVVRRTNPVVVPPAPPAATVAPPATPTMPPPTAPPNEPPSVLKWTASPSTLSIKGGAHAVLTITVVNPTNGNVNLPHPLSCPPELKPLHGAPIGGFVCTEMVQVMAPHSQLVQHYTIYATDTGAVGGAPLQAGQYLAVVENLHNVKVTVTN